MTRTIIVRVSKTLKQTVTMFVDVPIITDKEYPSAETLALDLVKARLKAGHDGGWQAMAPDTETPWNGYDGLPKLDAEIIKEDPCGLSFPDPEDEIQPAAPAPF